MAHFLLSEFLAGQLTILGMIRAVYTTVDAIIGEVERGKEHDTVAIEAIFHLPGQIVNALSAFSVVAEQQHGSLTMGESLTLSGFCNERMNELNIVFVGLRIFQRGPNFSVINEFGGVGRIDFIHIYLSF